MRNTIIWRILLLNWTAIVLPIAVVLILFFRYERQDNKAAVSDHLQDVAYSRAELVTEQGLFKDRLANILIEEWELENHPSPDKLEEQMQRTLFASPFLQSIIYTEKEPDGTYRVAAASLPQYRGLDVTTRSFMNEGISFGFGLNGQPRIFVTKFFKGGALTLSSDPQALFSSLMNTDYAAGSMRFAVLAQDGLVFASSDLALVGKPPPQKADRMSASVPIVSSRAQFYVDVLEELVVWAFQRHLWRSLGALALATLLTSLLFWVAMNRLTEPLQALMAMMSKVSSGDFTARYVRSGVGAEISAIGQSMNTMLDSFLTKEEEISEAQLKQELFSREMRIGHQIQQQILPQHLPMTRALDLAALAKPALEMGGDFYDVFLLEEEKKVLLVVADVTDKGISACLYSLALRCLLRGFSTRNRSVGRLLQEANNLFLRDTEKSNMFVTVFAAVVDLQTREMTYSCAGHPPALLRHEGTVQRLSTEGVALGVESCDNVVEKTIILQPQDVLLIYSDGVSEAMNEEGELWGEQRLVHFVQQAQVSSAQNLLDQLITEVEKFEGKAPQHDDITCIALLALPETSA